MRAVAIFAFLVIAVPCHAEDPLESLNSVKDTIATMEQTLKQRSGPGNALSAVVASERLPVDDRLYFTSDEALDGNDWVVARPCTEEVARSRSENQSCVGQNDGTVSMSGHVWKSRPATAADIEIGAVVVVQDVSGGGWYLTRVTDISEKRNGYVATAVPYRAPVKGLRVVE